MVPTRRELLSGAGRGTAGVVLAAMAPVRAAAAVAATPAERLGRWRAAGAGLPAYLFEGALPHRSVDRTGADAQEPLDPAFLIGNHRISVFTHASGVMQVITGERAWARVNAADTINYGDNGATLTLGDVRHELVGLRSLAADPARTTRTFGCGFARYDYAVAPGITARRVVSVAPSAKVGMGNAALVVTITLANASSRPAPFRYRETLRNHYVPMGLQKTPAERRAARYESSVEEDAPTATALSRTRFVATRFAPATAADEADRHDRRPAGVFLHARAGSGVEAGIGRSNDAALAGDFAGVLPPRGTVTLTIVIGLTYGGLAEAAAQAAALLGAAGQDADEGLFAADWRHVLPRFARERDPALRTEMIWNAHALEALATYTAYFDETFVPQGTIYAFEDGEAISNRDHLQALLPLCYTNPALARSSLRHTLKQTSQTGEIKRGPGGYGFIAPGIFKESDEQLYLFMALGEYLRVTGDHTILDDRVSFYPRVAGSDDTVLGMLGRHFAYLRDEVGLGPNGLVRMLNSDWSDSFFHNISPNVTQGSAESHMNSAMALAVMPVLIAGLKAARRDDARALIDAMEDYRAALHAAFFKDLGNRDFAARCYLNDGRPSFGVDILCLEAQGWLLRIPDLPAERRRRIYARVKAATGTPERVGFRIHERPILDGRNGEDIGIWFAIEHQLIAAVAGFDKAEARRLLGVTGFRNYARQYPGQALGRWTASDSLISTLGKREGLFNYWYPTFRESGFGYCSHPHSWPLYNYHLATA